MSRSSLFRRLRSAAGLDREEFWLAMQAIAWLVWARVALATMGFPRIRASLEAARVGATRGTGYPRAVRRAVDRAARTVPGSACLPQAVVAYRLLRAGGHPAELTIGVRRGATGAAAPDAHAWVRSATTLVTGDGGGTDLAEFTELTRVRSGA